MSEYTYQTILSKAKEGKKNVETEYKTKLHNKWGYYIAKAIQTPNKKIKQITIQSAPKPSGTYISTQIYKKDYLTVAKYITDFAEKRGRMPNYVQWGSKRIRVRDYVYMLCRILVFYDQHKELPKYANINTKCWTKPTEYPNKVYGLFVKYTGLKPKYLDDVCDWAKNKVDYEFYFDDQKSNEQVIKEEAGNCTDLLQVLCNMADAMDYDWEVIHTQCKQSGTGHVYGRFKKKGTSNWFVRDIACISDESRYCVWCEVPNGGYQLAKNPNWFLQNLNR